MLTNITQDQEFMNGLKILGSLESYSRKKIEKYWIKEDKPLSTPIDLLKRYNRDNDWDYTIKIPKGSSFFAQLEGSQIIKNTPIVLIEKVKQTYDPSLGNNLDKIFSKSSQEYVGSPSSDVYFWFPYNLDRLLKISGLKESIFKEIIPDPTEKYESLFVNLVKAVK